MISGSNYGKKLLKPKSLHQKMEQKSEKDSRSVTDSVFSQRPKGKARIERQRPAVKQQIKKLGEVRLNEVKRDISQNQSSQVFSKTNDKIKISVRKCNQYFQKVNFNGFSTFPPPFTQIVPPVLIIIMIVEIVLMTVYFLENYQSYIIFGLLTFLLIPTVYFWYITTSISPTDSVQLQHLEQIRNPSTSTFQPYKHKYFCNLCKTCTGQKSFHCNKCHRCVEYFDHHCKWLNNCIGAKNYFEFIQLIVWSQLFMIFFFSQNAFVIVKICNEYEELPALLWYAVGTVAISVTPFVALTILLSLHLYLVVAKRTTIELILENRRKNKIHPQNSNDALTEKINKQKIQNPIPDESPIGSPSLYNQNSMLKDMNEQNNESLIKFMTNLNNNLKFSKKSSNQKENAQDVFIQRKINFKPTILKKTTSFARNQFKSSTVKANKVEIQVEERKQITNQEHSKQNEDQILESDQSQIEETTKNLVTRLRFSTKNQIMDDDDEPNESKTDRNTERHPKKSHTDRPEYESRKQNYPKKLQPLSNNQTERKIKFKTKIQTFDKQNKSKIGKQAWICSMSRDSEQKYSRRSKSKKKNNQIQSSKNTRLFQVFPVDNSQTQKQ